MSDFCVSGVELFLQSTDVYKTLFQLLCFCNFQFYRSSRMAKSASNVIHRHSIFKNKAFSGRVYIL
jgi:hypothetical protein